jgi:hypothetical protein
LYAKDTSNRTTKKKRESVHMTIAKKPKVDERNKNQTKERTNEEKR